MASCGPDGHVIYYFAPPCMSHGGDAGPFGDVPANHANANAISYLKAKGILKGYPDGTFKPDQTINRAEFLKIVAGVVLQGGYCVLEQNAFTDTDPNAWYAYDVCMALRSDVVAGYPDGSFRPASPVNFAEAAKIFVRFKAAYDPAVMLPPATSTWFEIYARYLSDFGAIPPSIKSFNQFITRGEMAEVIWRVDAGMTTLPLHTYETLMGEAGVGDGCQIGGCSAELCVKEGDPAISNCIYRPEFACYKSGVCEKQPDDSCGWRPTPELAQCLANTQ